MPVLIPLALVLIDSVLGPVRDSVWLDCVRVESSRVSVDIPNCSSDYIRTGLLTVNHGAWWMIYVHLENFGKAYFVFRFAFTCIHRYVMLTYAMRDIQGFRWENSRMEYKWFCVLKSHLFYIVEEYYMHDRRAWVVFKRVSFRGKVRAMR